jgi:translation initiation factor 1
MQSSAKTVQGPKPVERLFPFVLRSRNLIVGRDTLSRSKSKLHFVLITTDLSENSRDEILAEFAHYPVVQPYQTHDLKTHFGLEGAKVVGFAKSGLAQSLYAELKQYRLNKPEKVSDPPSPSAGDQTSTPDPDQKVRETPPRKSRGRVDILRQKAGRGGKTVTVVRGFVGIGLPEKERLSRAMQKACGSGGTVKEGRIEIQGDKREQVARILVEANFSPVFAGG